MSFDSNYYYRLSTMFRGDKMDLDIFNGGEFNNMPHLTEEANFSGQYWSIQPSEQAGYYRLSTMFRGSEMCLDVFNGGRFNNMLHLVPKANYSGQFWKIEETSNQPGYFRLSTMFRGDNMDLDIFNGGEFNNMPHLTEEANYSGQYWLFEKTDQKIPQIIVSYPKENLQPTICCVADSLFSQPEQTGCPSKNADTYAKCIL